MNRVILLLVVFVFAGSSCKKDEKSFSDSLVGTWALYSAEINSCENPLENIDQVIADEDGCVTFAYYSSYTISVCDLSFTFNNDMTGSIFVGYYGDLDETSMTYTVDDEAETVLICDGDDFCLSLALGEDGILYYDEIEDYDDCVLRYGFRKS